MYIINKTLLSFILLGITLPNIVFASEPPVLIEFYGKNTCFSDTIIQESLQKIVKSQENIFIINCRTRTADIKEAKTYTLKLCTNRRALYDQKFGTFTFRSPTFLIVNGRWDANYSDMNPAINLGRKDDVKEISLSVHDDVIDISLPEIKSDLGYGDIFIYTYLPTVDEKAIFVDSDITLTKKMKDKINKNKSVPFVTKARTSPFYFRPVFAAERIAKWNGNKMDLTFSLNSMSTMSGTNYSGMSYIVVLHEGGGVGNVLAVGEYMSLQEINNTLPHSDPSAIKLISPDPKDVPQKL